MPLKGGYSKSTIKKLIDEGYKPDTGKGPNQAVAIAQSEARKYKKKKK
jgi:hypothetical protein